MREIVETATDVAAIAIADPSLLGSLRAASIRRYLRDPITVERFHVPSGRLLVAGEQDFIGPDREGERLMGREIDVDTARELPSVVVVLRRLQL